VASSKEQKHWLFDYLRDHPAILVSSVYITASIVGLVFSWASCNRSASISSISLRSVISCWRR
jgi:hypothetical protein